MALTTWRPMNDLFSIHSDMGRVFDGFLGSPRRTDTNGKWAPVVDISETPDAVLLHAELPGVSEKDVHVSVTNNTLTLKGDKKYTATDKKENYHRVERAYGTFQRTFALPRNLKGEDTAAAFKNGVLTITVPKAEVVEPREIQISAE